MKYKKGKVEIEAIQFDGNFDEIENFVGGDAEWRGNYLVVATPQGALRVLPGWWVVKDDKGAFSAINTIKTWGPSK